MISLSQKNQNNGRWHRIKREAMRYIFKKLEKFWRPQPTAAKAWGKIPKSRWAWAEENNFSNGEGLRYFCQGVQRLSGFIPTSTSRNRAILRSNDRGQKDTGSWMAKGSLYSQNSWVQISTLSLAVKSEAFFLAVLGFELRASCLYHLGHYTSPVLCWVFLR
jgi:hypothetical protein